MRKIYLIMLLFTGFTGFAFLPPIINNPAPLTPCDINSDGIEVVDLTPVISEVLGALNPSLYTLTFHTSLAAANSDVNPIIPINAFLGTSGQTLYIRVEENADTTNFSTTTLLLLYTMLPNAAINGPTTVCGGNEITIAFQGSGGGEPFTFTYTVNGGPVLTVTTPFFNAVGINLPTISSGTYDINLISVQTAIGCINTINLLHHIDVFPTPTLGVAQDLSIVQIPFVGTAVFDLTVNENALVNGSPNTTVLYFPTLMDAQVNANTFAFPSAFLGTNGQIIWARVENIFGCAEFASFHLYITNPDIVFIPDLFFKEELILATPTVDINSDGEIQVTEALAYTHLTVDGTGINSLEGINSFPNLIHLGLGGFNMSTMDISGLTNLTELFCDNNQFTSLDVSNSVNLLNLQCANNNLTSINISGLNQLKFFSCYLNELTTIAVAGLSTLESLDCRNNQLASLDLSGLSNLQILNCNTNLLTTLDVSQSPNLLQLACAYNPIVTLDVSPYPNLTYLACGSIELTTVDVSSLVNLTTFYLYGSQQNSMDISNNTSISYTIIHDCPNMTILNLKNGYTALNFDLNTIPNLNFICANESNINQLYAIISIGANGINSNAVINTYCTFTPGGNYNTINGTMLFDVNNNGCAAFGSPQSFIKAKIDDGSSQGTSFTNTNGNYVFFTQAGNFTITPAVENPAWFTFSPANAIVNFADNNNNISTNNFCISANGIHPDVEIVIAPITPARPGFDATYQVVYKNKGNQTLSGNITFTYDETVLDFVNATQIPDTQSTGLLNWNYSNLLPYENRSFYLTLNVNSPIETPAVNIGNILNFVATITPVVGDENAADNLFSYNQTVVGSFDPNDITCIEGNVVPPSEIGNYLHYIINFENTGTYQAENIVVSTTIDATKFDVNSLQMLNTSHNAYIKQTGNVVEFIFENIALDSGGHGNVLLKIRSKNDLVTGDSVSKRADIFFDYNAPIDTGIANTTFQALSNLVFEVDNAILIYPNPTTSLINIQSDTTIKSIQLFDVQGRLLQTSIENKTSAVIDISEKTTGIYFLKITSDKGTKVEKIIKK